MAEKNTTNVKAPFSRRKKRSLKTRPPNIEIPQGASEEKISKEERKGFFEVSFCKLELHEGVMKIAQTTLSFSQEVTRHDESMRERKREEKEVLPRVIYLCNISLFKHHQEENSRNTTCKL